jgi:hypothetical protein
LSAAIKHDLQSNKITFYIFYDYFNVHVYT